MMELALLGGKSCLPSLLALQQIGVLVSQSLQLLLHLRCPLLDWPSKSILILLQYFEWSVFVDALWVAPCNVYKALATLDRKDQRMHLLAGYFASIAPHSHLVEKARPQFRTWIQGGKALGDKKLSWDASMLAG